MKKYLLPFLFVFYLSGISLFAGTGAGEVQQRIDSLLANDFFKKASISVDVFDLNEGKTLYQHQNKLLLHPASNMKILTTSAALNFLGTDYEFETNFYYTGKIENSILVGDLYVVGGCDPDFTSADLEKAVLKIKELGIKRIEGNIYGDISALDGWYWGEGWMWDDDPSTDFPFMSALNINKDAVAVSVSAGEKGKTKVELTPNSEYFRVMNLGTVDSNAKTNIEITRDWVNRTNDIIVEGNISPKSGAIKKEVNVFRSYNYFLMLFKEALVKHDIRVIGRNFIKDLPVDAVHITRITRKFGDVIVNLNKNSDNLSAEMTLRALALATAGKPASAANGIKMVDSLITLCGMNPREYKIVDGSGVSHYSLITTELLLSVVKYMYNNKPELYKVLYNSFPIAGVDGSLSNRMKRSAAENNVHAKTGTLSGISALSGYVTTKSNHQVAFSIMVQNYIGGKSNASKYEDAICKILAEIE